MGVGKVVPRSRIAYSSASSRTSTLSLPNSVTQMKHGPGELTLGAGAKVSSSLLPTKPCDATRHASALFVAPPANPSSLVASCSVPSLPVQPGRSASSCNRLRTRISTLSAQSSLTSFAGTPGMNDARHGAHGSARLCDADGRLLAHAAVWLYHPPFNLDAAVTYMPSGGFATEVFLMPKSWCVLRSRKGLLVWLGLFADVGLASTVQDRPGDDWDLRFALRSHQGDAVLHFSGHVEGRAEGRVPLLDDEGLLNSSCTSGEPVLRLKLEADFDTVAKLWLSEAHMIDDLR